MSMPSSVHARGRDNAVDGVAVATTIAQSAHVDPLVVDRVRALVRDRGTDPLVDPRAVRAAILDVLDDVVLSHPDSTSESLVDIESWAQEIHDAVAGYGPLQRLFDDPEIEEVWWNEPNRVFCAKRGRSELTTVVLTETQAHDVVERMLRTSGRRVDVSQPFVDALLPDGSRLHVVIPDITRRHWAVNIRRHVLPASRLDDLVEIGTLTEGSARFLTAAVVAGLNIVVAGGTQAGKTTLLSCLLNAVPANERVVTCEEVFEVRLDRPDWVAMQTRQVGLEGTGEISLRRLVIEALRMRPHRLVVGEVRQAEALDLLVALNSGMPGMTSVHANSARDAVTKLCVLPMLAGENVTAAYIVPTVASAVDLVVHAATGADGRRRVREVVAVSGRVEDGVIETTDIFTTRSGELVRASGFPPHADRFEAHGIDLLRVLTGH
jgi:pilus assembly protein CpaF